MSRLFLSAAALAAALTATAAPAQAALGPDAAACTAGANRPALLVSVNGFKNRVGKLRIQLYGGNPADFLERGKKMKRIDIPVTRAGAMNVCVAVPRTGTYAIAVRHDADNNGKTNWNDGGGFSNNPHLSLLKLKPSARAVSVAVGGGVKVVPVVLNYRSGLSIAPDRPVRMARVALLSNPRSTGNRALLPQVRSFCAAHKDIFHYEVEDVDQIGTALRTIALIEPRVLVINGGDGTVQAALTEIYNGRHFGDNPPPVAVLPNGKTNLIAYDLGAGADALQTLERVLAIARTDLAPHIVQRELITLSGGAGHGKPVLGMFLGGAYLADTMLYCRNKLYPLGLPNWLAHALALMLGLLGVVLGRRASFLPPPPAELRVTGMKGGELNGKFAFLMVTTLQRLLFKGSMPGAGARIGAMQMLVIDRNIGSLLGAFFAAVRGRLGRKRMSGVHLERGDEIRIEGDHSNVLLDGELFQADCGRPIVLRKSAPVPFVALTV